MTQRRGRSGPKYEGRGAEGLTGTERWQVVAPLSQSRGNREEKVVDRRQFAIGAGTLALAAGLKTKTFAQAAPAMPDYYPADYKDIIQASRAEGKLLVYSNMSKEHWSGVVKTFKKLYPWINVETLDLGASELVERYLAESSTGSQTADVIATGAPDALLRLRERGGILDYASPEASKIPAWANVSPGLYTFVAEPQLMIWNKALLPKDLVPKGFGDLVEKVTANPDAFRRKMTTYGAHFGSFGYSAVYAIVKRHGDKAWAWFDKLGPLTRIERSSGPMVEKVTTGEYVFGYNAGSANPWLAARDPARANIFGWKLVEDGQVFMVSGIAVTKRATNVNSAKLWLDVVLSHEGQVGLIQGGKTPMRSGISEAERGDSHTYESLVKIIGEENAFRVEYDPAMITDYNAFIARWKQAFKI
jgi:iron(III) transport system substrate-binding protein